MRIDLAVERSPATKLGGRLGPGENYGLKLTGPRLSVVVQPGSCARLNNNPTLCINQLPFAIMGQDLQPCFNEVKGALFFLSQPLPVDHFP